MKEILKHLQKSRLVVDAYNDKDHDLLTYDPAAQRTSKRIILMLYIMEKHLRFFPRHIAQV